MIYTFQFYVLQKKNDFDIAPEVNMSKIKDGFV